MVTLERHGDGLCGTCEQVGSFTYPTLSFVHYVPLRAVHLECIACATKRKWTLDYPLQQDDLAFPVTQELSEETTKKTIWEIGGF